MTNIMYIFEGTDNGWIREIEQYKTVDCYLKALVLASKNGRKNKFTCFPNTCLIENAETGDSFYLINNNNTDLFAMKRIARIAELPEEVRKIVGGTIGIVFNEIEKTLVITLPAEEY